MAKHYDESKINELKEDANAVLTSSEEEEVDTVLLQQIMGAEETIQQAPKVKVLIHNQEGPDGNKPIFVAVNGVGYLIPREKPILVPRPVVSALETAVETRYYREEKDGQSFGPVLERNVRRFPFTVFE